MGKALGTIVSVLISICVLIFVMRMLGISVTELSNFIKDGFRDLVSIFDLFRKFSLFLHYPIASI